MLLKVVVSSPAWVCLLKFDNDEGNGSYYQHYLTILQGRCY